MQPHVYWQYGALFEVSSNLPTIAVTFRRFHRFALSDLPKVFQNFLLFPHVVDCGDKLFYETDRFFKLVDDLLFLWCWFSCIHGRLSMYDGIWSGMGEPIHDWGRFALACVVVLIVASSTTKRDYGNRLVRCLPRAASSCVCNS